MVRGGSLELFDVERPAAVVAGCDPVIELAARLVEVDAGPRVVPVATSSGTAIAVLRAGRSHAVMVHGMAGTLPDPPVAVRRWRVARWQVGLAAPLDLPAIATLITTVVGVGGAYALARFMFPCRGLVEAIVSLPIVLPPTVLGYYLLVAIGRNSPIGRAYEALFDQQPVFTLAGRRRRRRGREPAYCLRTAAAAITAIDTGYEEAARVAGLHGTRLAFTVTLPLAGRGIIAGISLAFARALGELRHHRHGRRQHPRPHPDHADRRVRPGTGVRLRHRRDARRPAFGRGRRGAAGSPAT